MHDIRTEIDIDASAARVWSVLTAFDVHPDWNPFVRSIRGDVTPGARLTVTVQPAGGRGMTFRPTVLVADPGRELRWRGRFLVPGLLDGEHYFQIIPTGASRVRFVHGESFSGLLVPLLRGSLDRGTKGGFIAMNEALKARAEYR